MKAWALGMASFATAAAWAMYPGDSMPDPSLTPGAVASTDQAQVCAYGYARAHRPAKAESYELKREVFNRYHLDWSMHSSYEMDHRLPLCAGGSSDIGNLWPQPWPEAERKDRLEALLCRMACDGSMLLSEAQKVFLSDWRKDGRY